MGSGERSGMKTADYTLRGTRILIAEDDPIQALNVKEILRHAGAEIVGPCATLKQTLFMIRSFPVSAALLDVNVRDGEIFPAASELLESGAGIVFCTGYADLEGLQRNWPAARVLTKPALPKSLISAVYQASRSASWEDCPSLFGAAGSPRENTYSLSEQEH